MAKKKVPAVDVSESENIANSVIADLIVEEAEEASVPGEKPASSGFCVYIGPTIRSALQKGTILKGSKEEVLCNEAVKSALEKYPLISSLIIPGHSLSESLIKITTPGNYLYENYRKLSVK